MVTFIKQELADVTRPRNDHSRGLKFHNHGESYFIIGHEIKLWLNVWVDLLQSRGHHYFDRAVTNMDYCPFDLLVHKNQAIE